MSLASVAVYCASSPGWEPSIAAAAEQLGRALAERQLRLVYGGGHVGLMGTLVDATLAAGGDVLGVITTALLEKEVAHTGLPELLVVDTMHQRKAAMADAADAFIMLPGGFGTIEEFFEVLTWTQLGVHQKPCGILNTNGFFAPLQAQLERTVGTGFVRMEHKDLVLVREEASDLLDQLESWTPVLVDKWIDRTDR